MEEMGVMGDPNSKGWTITSWQYVFGIVSLACTCFGVVWGIYSYYYSAEVATKEETLKQVIAVKQERLELAREQLLMARTELAKADSVAQTMIDSLTSELQAQASRERRFQASISTLPQTLQNKPQVQEVLRESQLSEARTAEAIKRLGGVKDIKWDVIDKQLSDPNQEAALDRLLLVR